jgi:hypothetical protein
MAYFVLLFSPEVQSLLFANVQLPALSMLIALTLGNNLVLATDETLQVSANGTDLSLKSRAVTLPAVSITRYWTMIVLPMIV